MTMYVIENDNGEVLDRIYYEFTNDVDRTMVFDEPIAPAEYAKHYGGHVVPLVEKPKLVVVSEDMASWLSDAKEMRMPIEFLARCKVPDGDQEDMLRAYVLGWTVEKTKRYVMPMPGTEYHNIQMHGNAQYYAIKGTENWRPDAIALGTDDAVKHGYTVTQADIDTAPAWVKAITPVEVTDDEQ